MATPLDKANSQAQLELPMPEGSWAHEFAVIVKDNEIKSNPTFTGMKVFKGDPDKYARIVMERIKLGMTVRQIAALEHVSPQTVTAIMRMEEAGKTAEQYRDEAQTDLAVLVKLTADRIKECLMDEDRMKACGPRDLAYLLKELAEKKELLSGGATHRGETVNKEEAEKEEALRHTKQAQELLKDGVIDIEPIEETEQITER